jgi:hypothetical protein
MTLPNCDYPNCPSGQWAIDVKDDLKVIQANQEKHYEAMTKFGAILAHMDALQKTQDRIDKSQDNIYARLNSIDKMFDTKLGKQEFVWGVVVAGVGIGVLEFIFRVVIQ